MHSGLTGTKHFGFTPSWLRGGLRIAQTGDVRSLSGNAELSQELGIGTIQLEALGVWMRLAGLVGRVTEGQRLSPLGRLICSLDAELSDAATWWVLHWQLARSYTAWGAISGLEYGVASCGRLDQEIGQSAPSASAVTLRNARTSVLRALEGTPLGHELGLVRLESDGRRVTGLTKLPVRHGGAPLAAVAYAFVDWARREELSSAPLESLAASDGPGPILHMSEGALERYAMDIDGAFRGRVLSYGRTAGLNEVYFKREFTALQVLASHYVRERDDVEWTDALARAVEEVGDDGAD